MYCPACGKEILEESVFCIHCGVRISDPSISRASRDQAERSVSYGESWIHGCSRVRTSLTWGKSGFWTLAFSPDGKQLAAVSLDKPIIVWDATTREACSVLSGHKDFARAIAFSPDGQVLASGGTDDIVILWDIATGQATSTLEASGFMNGLVFSPDGTILAATTWDKVSLWNLETMDECDKLRGHRNFVMCLAFSPNGEILARTG